MGKRVIEVVGTMSAIRIRIRRTENIEKRASCNRREAMHVATIGRVEDGAVARSSEVSINLDFSQPHL